MTRQRAAHCGADFDRLGYGEISRGGKVLRALGNPSFEAVLLIRTAQCDSRYVYHLCRWALLSVFAIDVGRSVSVGRGLYLPHPVGVVIGAGVELGEGVTLYQNVTLGLKNGGCPRIEDGVVVYPGSVIVGPIVVGRGAVVGANSFVDRDVAPHTTVYGSSGTARPGA